VSGPVHVQDADVPSAIGAVDVAEGVSASTPRDLEYENEIPPGFFVEPPQVDFAKVFRLTVMQIAVT